MSVWVFPQRERRVPRGWTELRQEYRRGLKVRQIASLWRSGVGVVKSSVPDEVCWWAQVFARGAGQTAQARVAACSQASLRRDFGPLELGGSEAIKACFVESLLSGLGWCLVRRLCLPVVQLWGKGKQSLEDEVGADTTLSLHQGKVSRVPSLNCSRVNLISGPVLP